MLVDIDYDEAMNCQQDIWRIGQVIIFAVPSSAKLILQ